MKPPGILPGFFLKPSRVYMRRGWSDVLIVAAIMAAVPLIIVLMIRLTPLPPISEMEYARETLSQAGTFKADIYSKKQYTEARILYDSAMVFWQKQNRRFLYFRNYSQVLKFAKLSAKQAVQAAENSINSTSNLKTKLRQKIDSLNDLVSGINKLFSTYPLTAETRSRISKGKMLLKEAEIVYNKGLFLQASRKLTDSEYLLTYSYDDATANLKNYFKSYSVWKNWAAKTINESKRNNDYSIIIDKFSRKCYVYLNGTRKLEFDTELGINWVGDKRHKGDNATPEGMYKITRKFDSRKTKYYKALLLDYPNKEDMEKFNSEIAGGTLPGSAKIGGLIEIHGNGGKGIDWTEGCIALTDNEMDVVYNLVKVGTPVTIVGSLIDLENIVNR
jgi:murein L,D-transpeptidase YafK